MLPMHTLRHELATCPNERATNLLWPCNAKVAGRQAAQN